MHIDIHRSNVRFPRAHALGLAERLKAAFARLADRVARIIVRLAGAAKPGAAARECTVEIHFADGEVVVVKERQRRLGSLLRRVTQRAGALAGATLARQASGRSAPSLPPAGSRRQPVRLGPKPSS